MSKTENTFVWFDLNTTDKAGARAFYTALFGWTIQDTDKGGGHTSLQNGEQGFGGMGEARGGAPSHWLGYIDVSDLDARVRKLVKMGGQALMPGMDIPDVGRIAVLADPSGAAFALYQAAGSHDGIAWEPSRRKTGDIGWSDLTTNDVAQAKGFYGEAFGWTAGDGMGEPGKEYYMLSSGGQPLGGLMLRPDMAPVCAWSFYVNVADADATAEKAKALGGRVLHAETVPGMVRFAILQDPQGAVIGIAQSLSAP